MEDNAKVIELQGMRDRLASILPALSRKITAPCKVLGMVQL